MIKNATCQTRILSIALSSACSCHAQKAKHRLQIRTYKIIRLPVGLIEKKIFHTAPAIVIYQTTAYSDTLKDVLSELGRWGEQHREKVRQSMRDNPYPS